MEERISEDHGRVEKSATSGERGAKIYEDYLESRKAGDIQIFQEVASAEMEQTDPRVLKFAEAFKYYLAPSASERKYQLLEWGLSPELSPYCVFEGPSSSVTYGMVEILLSYEMLPAIAKSLLDILLSGK